ncbi:MAG: T9SS type A sorting domain-containing protein [bacterium]|nr:T9SS type A sorting domain-containing protein [bacterium]
MKKLILYISALFILQTAVAQSISFSPKTSKGQGASTSFQLVANSNFTNNTADSIFEWMVIEVNSTSGWEFGMCDPGNCLTDLIVGSKGDFILGAGKTGEFKGDFVINSKSGNGIAKVACYLKNNPAIVDTVEFQLNAWITSVKEVSNNREFTFYPNPAKDKLVIKYQSRDNINVDIYNVLGSKVKSFNHNGIETEINISDLQKGLYFIRFKDGSQTISKPFSKSE